MPDGSARMKLCIHWLERMQGKLATASGLAVYVLKAVKAALLYMSSKLTNSLVSNIPKHSTATTGASSGSVPQRPPLRKDTVVSCPFHASVLLFQAQPCRCQGAFHTPSESGPDQRSTDRWARPAKHGPLCPAASGTRPFLSFRHQQRAKASRVFEKNKTRFVGNVSWECIFTAGKFKKVLRDGVL